MKGGAGLLCLHGGNDLENLVGGAGIAVVLVAHGMVVVGKPGHVFLIPGWYGKTGYIFKSGVNPPLEVSNEKEKKTVYPRI